MSRLSDLSNTLYYIAESLRDLDKIVSLPNCNGCGKLNTCEYRPAWGRMTRYNCPLWNSEQVNIKDGKK